TFRALAGTAYNADSSGANLAPFFSSPPDTEEKAGVGDRVSGVGVHHPPAARDTEAQRKNEEERENKESRKAGNKASQNTSPETRSPTSENWRKALFGQCNGVELYYTQRWVQTSRWRYVFNGFDEDELYDLENDPHEMVNLAADPKFTDIK